MSITALAIGVGAYLMYPKAKSPSLDHYRPANMSNVKQYMPMNLKDPMISQIGSVMVGRYNAKDERFLLADHELQFPSSSVVPLPPKKLMMGAPRGLF